MVEIIAGLTEYLGKLFGKASASFVVVIIVAITLGANDYIDPLIVQWILTVMLFFALADVIYKYIVKAINDTRLLNAETSYKILIHDFSKKKDTMTSLKENAAKVADEAMAKGLKIKLKSDIKKIEKDITDSRE